MPEEDGKVFKDAYELYNKYRWEEIRTDEQLNAMWNDIRGFAEAHKWRENILAMSMAAMLMDVFCELYKDGKKPAIPDYFGRSDL